jgi:very-long-chain (3R)-3-hydroxyacyl-CoA dehydratase
VVGADCDRYSLFYVLYPIGIAAEWWLMYRAVGPVGEVSPLLPPVFYFLLALYVPGEFVCDCWYRKLICLGAYYMFSHMVRQRRKVLAKSKES